MRITVHAPDLPFPIVVPIPLRLMGVLVSITPESVFETARKQMPNMARGFLTKPALKYLFQEGNDILREYRGLEILSVISAEGEQISVRL